MRPKSQRLSNIFLYQFTLIPICFGMSDSIHLLFLWTRLICESEIVPPIGSSVTRVISHLWILGFSIICESVKDQKDVIVDWQDGGRSFHLYENDDNSSALIGDVKIDRIHLGGTGVAVWSIGFNAICKVYSW